MYDQSLFPEEVQQFFRRPRPSTNNYLTAIFKTPDRDIPVFKVKTFLEYSPFGEEIASSAELEVLMLMGDYNHLLQAEREVLKVQLIFSPVKTGADETDDLTRSEYSVTYVAKSKARRNNVMEGNADIVTNIDQANNAGMQFYKFQLIEEPIFYLRTVAVGGIFKNSVPGDVLRHLLDRESSRIKGDDQMDVRGVDMVPYDNTSPRDQLVIPHGTRLVDVPDLIQRKSGVYNTGLEFFFQRGQWYVWPTFNTRRFNTARRTLTVVNIPPTKAPHVENTYFMDGESLFVLSTGVTITVDNTESMQLNLGNGVRYTDARKIVSGFGKAEDNKYSIERNSINSEYIHTERQDGLNNAPVAKERITSNPMLESSKVALNNVITLITSWQNSDPSLVYPGMPVKYIYLAGNEARTRYGCLYATEFLTEVAEGQLMGNKHHINGSLTLVLDRADSTE